MLGVNDFGSYLFLALVPVLTNHFLLRPGACPYEHIELTSLLVRRPTMAASGDQQRQRSTN